MALFSYTAYIDGEPGLDWEQGAVIQVALVVGCGVASIVAEAISQARPGTSSALFLLAAATAGLAIITATLAWDTSSYGDDFVALVVVPSVVMAALFSAGSAVLWALWGQSVARRARPQGGGGVWPAGPH